MWGDESVRSGQLEVALRCWEEVQDLKEGTRFSEAESRLSTIYQRLANSYAAKHQDEQALTYLGKLNNIAQNPRNFAMAADLYERDGKLDLAIDQLRKAISFSHGNLDMNHRLALLLNRRGKELLDQGDTDAGYGYLQQAKSLDPANSLPPVTLRNVNITFNDGKPSIQGQVWNPGDQSVNALTIRVDLCETSTSQVLWTKELKVVDEFVAPLNSHDSRSFQGQVCYRYWCFQIRRPAHLH